MVALIVLLGVLLIAFGLVGFLYPDRLGKFYSGYINDQMPKRYGKSHPWHGTDRGLSIRLSIAWIVAGSLFILVAIVALNRP
jgi:hypothetical protein